MSQTWFRVAFVNAITHAVPGDLLGSLIIDMSSRGHAIENFEEKYGRENAKESGGNPKAIDKWSFDCGGFWIKGEPEETVIVDGLSVDIPCAQFDVVRSSVVRSQPRTFADGTAYHKLKFWIHATVLTLNQRDDLADALASVADRACQRADEFTESLKSRRAAQ